MMKINLRRLPETKRDAPSLPTESISLSLTLLSHSMVLNEGGETKTI